ncbi:MAG: YceI family protein [Sphingobium sp.]
MRPAIWQVNSFGINQRNAYYDKRLRIQEFKVMRSIKMLSMAVAIGLGLGTGALAGVVSTDAAKVAAGSYELDPSHTTVSGRIDHMGFSSTTIRFAKVSGDFTFDPAHAETPRLRITIDTASLSTDWPTRDAELRGAAFFNSAKFPTAQFDADSLTKVDANHAKVNGQLTLLGVTRPVQLDVTLLGAGTGMMGDVRTGFIAHATIKRSDFGMTAYIPAVGDQVELTIDAEFSKKK